MTIKGDVLSYFMEHEGERVSLRQLMKVTGRPSEQVRNAINNLRNDQHDNGVSFRDNIEVVVRGDVWRFQGKEAEKTEATTIEDKPANRVFEEVGTTVDGSILVKCEDGKFYKLLEV